jgi:hypothetical protein
MPKLEANPPSGTVGSAARTTGGQSAGDGVTDNAALLAVLVNVSAVSGTSPSLTIGVQWSADGGATWADADPVDTFTAITAAGVKAKTFQRKSPMHRITWAITGTTPSFTFDVKTWPFG